MNKNIYEKFFSGADVGEVIYNKPMKEVTTFKVGGPCHVMILPKDERQVINAVKICRDNDLKYIVIGNGSNILVRDGGISGVVIALRENYSEISINGCEVYAQAGALLKHVAEKVAEQSLAGLEFAHGIPGSVGGAMTMNAGAYNGETKDVVKSVRVLNMENNIIDIENSNMNFRYRHSRVEEENLVVLGATYKLNYGDSKKIFATMEELMEKRSSKQPLEMASAGSTFKRPEGYFAGQLIDNAGLRGVIHGGAQVSQKHCGFVVNKGDAKAQHILELIEVVQKTVLDNFGVVLEREVKVLGDD